MGLVLSCLGAALDLVVQAFQLLVLLQAELLVWLRPAQLVVGRIFGRNGTHVVLTIRFPSGRPRPGDESAVQTVLRMLRGLDWEEHRLAGRMVEPGKTTRRGPPRERPIPAAGFRVTHAQVMLRSGHERGVVKAWYLTRYLKWVDAVELVLLPTPGTTS